MTDILVQIIHGLLPSNTIALLSLIVLTFTLISVLKYTKITEELQKTAVRQQEASEKQTDELIKQRRLSIMPSLLHSIRARQSPIIIENNFYITNIGPGVAVMFLSKIFVLAVEIKKLIFPSTQLVLLILVKKL